MKKLSEYKDEEALDLLLDLMSPCMNIMSNNKDLLDELAYPEKRLETCVSIVRNNKKDVIEIMRILDGNNPDYHFSVMDLPFRLLEIATDKEFIDFLSLRAQEIKETSFGSAMENTEDNKE